MVSRASSRASLFRMTRRDCLLVIVGALSVLVFSRITTPQIPAIWNTPEQVSIQDPTEDAPFEDTHRHTGHDWKHHGSPPTAALTNDEKEEPDIPEQREVLPKTTVLAHAPGWTIFRNLYMSNGTLYIIRDPISDPEEEGTVVVGEEWPLVRMMTSTGLPGYATEESIREREPTDRDMSFIAPVDASTRWGSNVYRVGGTSWLYNDPPQFLSHYYHFVAELLLGTWAIYSNTMDTGITSTGETTAPLPSRAMFIRCDPWEYRDSSRFNAFFTKAAFPSITLESKHDWDDRIFMTRDGNKAWHFETVLLADRSASFRGQICGSQNQRTAAEAWEVVKDKASKWWWEPVRRATLQFAGVAKEIIDMPLGSDLPPVITYISRQGGRRSLIPNDHEALVTALEELAVRRRWKFNHVRAQELSKEEQLAVVASTTVLVGVHGNGLTHLVVQPPTSFSTVIEIFYPGGFAFDYEWTARLLRHKHFTVWNDTSHTWPDTPPVAYPEGFQGDHIIPVHGPYVAKLIERRLDNQE